MQKKLWGSLALLSTAAFADFSTQEFLYKEARVMGMGAANVAVGGYASSVFYNPAGLINIKSKGLQIDLFGLNVGGSKKFQDFADDIKDTDTDEEVTQVAKKYSGKAFNVTMSDYTAVSYRMDNGIVWSVGIVAGADVNFIPHANGGINGVVETHSRAYGGVVISAAKHIEAWDEVLRGKLTVGASVKYITQKSYEAGLDAGEISKHNDDLEDYLKDTYEVSDSGVALDIGVLYEPEIWEKWHPVFGLSIQNLGNLDFEAYGEQPIMVNAGVALSPKVPHIDHVTIALDYIDLFNAQQARLAVTDSANKTVYTNEDIDFDIAQHIRLGLSADVIDTDWFTVTPSIGLYQGAVTGGLALRGSVATLTFATYQEESGAKTGQLDDRRYMVSLNIGW